MKQILIILFVIVLGVLLFTSLYDDNGNLAFMEYGKINIEDRVSNEIIGKEVNGNKGKVEIGAKDLEDGSANIVTSIVVNYRSFDTLGEVTVLFISALGVSLLLGKGKKKYLFGGQPGFILKYGSRMAVSLIFIFGIYMISHGHLSPGGGFPGGSIMAAGILLLYTSDNDFRVKVGKVKFFESIAGTIYVVLGILGIAIGGYFLYNFLPTGEVGSLISGGLIPVVYAVIGLKVGSELVGIIDSFSDVEVTE